MSDSSEYRIYYTMLNRCLRPSFPEYVNYGAKGVTVCARWKESFENFLEDMGLRPSERHTLERLDGSKGYTPENVIWADYNAQARNRSMNTRNKTGVTGVHLDVYGYYIASALHPVTKKRLTRGFSVKTLGEDEAFRLACEARQQMIEEFNQLGAGYTEAHGKARKSD